MKKYIVLRKVINNEFMFVEAEDETQAKGLVSAGKGESRGTEHAGTLPMNCWQVEELTKSSRGNN